MNSLHNDQPASCFAKCCSCADTKGLAIALLIGSLVLGGGIAACGGIGVFTSQNMLPQWYAVGTIGHGGCMALFVSGSVLSGVGGISGIVLLAKTSCKKRDMQEPRPPPNADNVQVEVPHSAQKDNNREDLTGNKIRAADAREKMPPHALVSGNTETAKAFNDARHTAKVLNRAQYGWKPLHEAARYGEVEAIQALLKGGAIIEAIDYTGRRPLHIAAQYGQLEAIQALLDKYADDDATDNYGWTPLHVAVVQGEVESSALLLKNRAKIEAVDKNGRGPLHIAVAYNQVKAVKILLEECAEVDAKDTKGKTPLHLAAGNDNVEIVKLLLEKRASVYATNTSNQSPLDLTSNEQVRTLLRA